MLVPMILKGNGVKQNIAIETATNEDLGATIFKLMKLETISLEGDILKEGLEKAEK